MLENPYKIDHKEDGSLTVRMTDDYIKTAISNLHKNLDNMMMDSLTNLQLESLLVNVLEECFKRSEDA